MEIVHPIDPVHPQIPPAPHYFRRVEIVAPAVLDSPLIDSPCRVGRLCDRFERTTAANRIDRATFAERLREQNIALRRAETQAESLERFVPDRGEPTPIAESDRKRVMSLTPATRVELPEINKPIYREVIDHRIEIVDVLSRGNLLDILA